MKKVCNLSFSDLFKSVDSGEFFLDSDGNLLYICVWGGLVSKRKSANEIMHDLNHGLIFNMAIRA